MFLLITDGTAEDRRRVAEERLAEAANVFTLDAASLPFIRPSPGIPPPGSTIRLDDIDRAFPNQQVGGTRLVLTQSTYTVQKWIDALGPDGVLVATADREALGRGAAEAFQGRGPWARFEIVEAGAGMTRSGEAPAARHAGPSLREPLALLVAAYAAPDAAERVTLCRRAAAVDVDSPVAHLALASALRETNAMGDARAALDRTIALAPAWEAAHFEDGKFWLGYDDTERARDAFRRASDLMPTFAAAFSNLGATLGELDQPDAALAAFRQALAHDPRGFPILNNLGVVSREAGRLDESEAALRRAIELAPEFVFGYYNLGHTLFLAGRYDAALAAYQEGQRRDPEPNRRQGCRLALVRLAAGDAAGAWRDFWRFADAAPPAEREDLLIEAYEIASALLATRPDLAGARGLLDRIATEIGQ